MKEVRFDIRQSRHSPCGKCRGPIQLAGFCMGLALKYDSPDTRLAAYIEDQFAQPRQSRGGSLGRVAEWLGTGLQNLVRRFESAPDLFNPPKHYAKEGHSQKPTPKKSRLFAFVTSPNQRRPSLKSRATALLVSKYHLSPPGHNQLANDPGIANSHLNKKNTRWHVGYINTIMNRDRINLNRPAIT